MSPWIWLLITVFCLALCTVLPIWVKSDSVRRWIYWIILIPVSLVLMVYAYPAGIEVFKNLALTR
jgi:hypothetical protein